MDFIKNNFENGTDRVPQIMAASGSGLNKEIGNVANVILFGISSGKFQFDSDSSSGMSFKKLRFLVTTQIVVKVHCLFLLLSNI